MPQSRYVLPSGSVAMQPLPDSMNAGALAGNWSSPLEYVWQPAGMARWARWRRVVWSETVKSGSERIDPCAVPSLHYAGLA